MKQPDQRQRHLPITAWPPEDRPREALLERGAEGLPLSCLLAIVLRTGSRGSTAEDMARQLLSRFSGLRGMDCASARDLCLVKGMGRAKAAQVKACLEIGKRLFREKASHLGCIDGPERAVNFVALHYGPYLRDAPVEVACLILLNRRRTPVGTMELARGGTHGVGVRLGRILREAVKSSAAAIILVHNHPHGDCRPSPADISFTRWVRESCSLFGVRLVDHVIIGREVGDWYSFADHGLLSLSGEGRSPPRAQAPRPQRVFPGSRPPLRRFPYRPEGVR
jgi:DNA repair protein RadC